MKLFMHWHFWAHCVTLTFHLNRRRCLIMEKGNVVMFTCLYPLNANSLPSATKLRQGNIFTSVYQEFCPRGGGCLPQCMLRYTPPLWADTPLSRHPPGQTHTHRADPTPGQTATAADGTHPTGMHSCCKSFEKHTMGHNVLSIENMFSTLTEGLFQNFWSNPSELNC